MTAIDNILSNVGRGMRNRSFFDELLFWQILSDFEALKAVVFTWVSET
jgi:hypothetical protein